MIKLDVSGFSIVQEGLDGYMYESKSKGLVVIQSVTKEQDGKQWVHTSYSRKNRIPSYEDTLFIKKNFIGDDLKAIMIFPEKKEHVNIHPFCLHLWFCLDSDGLPDFTHGSGSI